MIQRFITIDDQVLMAYTGGEIAVVRTAQGIGRSQSRGGRLWLMVTDIVLEVISHQYMPEVRLNFQGIRPMVATPLADPFKLAIVVGDPTDKDSWQMQAQWAGCAIDVDDFEPRLSLNDDDLVVHTLPIDFVDMQQLESEDK